MIHDLGRLLRTISRLHPLQLVWRVPNFVIQRCVKHIPSTGGPILIPASHRRPTPHLKRFFLRERARAIQRVARLRSEPALLAYERAYGFRTERGPYSGSELRPYPAAVRARNLAVRSSFESDDHSRQLTEAARAVLIQLEFHLLGNHLLEDALGLVCAGAVTEGPEARLWRLVGEQLLDWQLPEQFNADGGHFERTPSYHIWLTCALLEAISLYDSTRRVAPPRWRHTAERAVHWLVTLQTPDKQYPLLNDSGLDAAAAPAFVADLAKAVGIVNKPVPAGISDLDGLLIARLQDGTCLTFDAGQDGASYQPGHVHADALAIELWIGGRRTCVDFGVASYSNRRARDTTRATRSHNTVEVAGRNSAEVWSNFRTGAQSCARVLDKRTAGAEVLLSGEHFGYARHPGKPRHCRTLHLQPGFLRIRDTVTSSRVPAISRIRVSAEQEAILGIFSDTGARRTPTVWYPSIAQPSAAVLFEAPLVSTGQTSHCEWRLSWQV